MGLLDFRGRYYARQKREVEARRGTGDLAGVSAQIRTAIRKWSMNWADGSRASDMRDLEFLRWAVDELANLSLSHSVRANVLRVAVNEAISHVSNDTNYWIDGRMQPAASAREWVEIFERLNRARVDLLEEVK